MTRTRICSHTPTEVLALHDGRALAYFLNYAQTPMDLPAAPGERGMN